MSVQLAHGIRGEPSSPGADRADAASKAAADQQLQQQMGQYYKTAIADLNSGNYSGALQAGLDSGKLYNTGYGSTTTDPLLIALESGQGLQALDPSKKWSSTDIQQYYNAFGQSDVTQGKQAGGANAGLSWGKNAYGSWGDPNKVAQDAQTNISTGGDNSAPDLMRFVGTRPSENTFQKWGEPVINAALAVWAPYLLPAATVAEGVGKGQSGWGLAENAAISAAGSYVGAGALGDYASAGLGSALGTGVSAATNAAGGALVSGATGAALGATGAALQGRNVGQAALLGGVNGAITGGVAGSGINNGSFVSNALTNTGTSAFKGAVDSSLTGGNALAGAAGGALKAGTGAIAGSILSGAGSIFNSGSTAIQSQNPNLTNPAQSGNTNMAYDFYGNSPVMDSNPFDPSNTSFDSSQGAPQTSNYGFDPSTLGNVDYGSLNQDIQNNSSLNNFGNQLNFQGGSASGNGSSSGGSSNPLAALASFLSGKGGSGAGGSSTLAQLLGLATNAGAGYVNHQAATQAAQQYANQTQYNPYSVNTNGGTTSFNGTNATSTLSPQQQQASNNLSALGNQASQNLQAGPQAASQGYFNNLQAADQDANNKFYQNNLDSQFANGVLSSTAGQYQSQAALGAINQHTLQNQTLANQFGQNQQQNQLNQLTASLNGNNQINQNQLSQLSAGGNLGANASQYNLQAFKPLAGANTTSNFGQLLSSIGNQYNNGNQQTGP